MPGARSKVVRASEIGTYLYCQRAWWYQRNGVASQNGRELADGNEIHQLHGQAVFRARLIRLAAYALLLAAVVFVAISLLR